MVPSNLYSAEFSTANVGIHKSYPPRLYHRYHLNWHCLSVIILIFLILLSPTYSASVCATTEDEIIPLSTFSLSTTENVENANGDEKDPINNPLVDASSSSITANQQKTQMGCALVVDSTSSLNCPYLDQNDYLTYGQSIDCFVSCMYGNSITTGYVSDFQFCIGYLDPIQGPSPILTSSSSSAPYTNSSMNSTNICPEDGLSDASLYGAITNLTGYDTTVISFTYIAPTVDQNIIIRVRTSGAEIRHSPLLISIKSPAESSSSSFFNFHNTSFIIIFAAVCTVAVAVTIACMYSYCEMQKARAEVSTKNAREQFWLNAVSVNDMPQPASLSHSLLR